MMRSHFVTDKKTSVNLKYVIDYDGIKTLYDYGRTFTYDAETETTTYTDGIQPVTYYRNGTKVTENYNFGAHNQPYREIIDPDGLNIVKTFGYESNTNQMVRIADANGNVTTYDVDSQGNRIREIAPEGKVTTFTYDLGFQTSAIDGDDRKTLNSRVYSATGWTDTTTIKGYNNELNIVTVRKYDLVGNMIQSIDANGNIKDSSLWKIGSGDPILDSDLEFVHSSEMV